MKKIDSNVGVQLLGMLGVLGGLIFVGLEMRQSQQIALAAQQQARTDTIVDIVGVYSEADSSWFRWVSDSLDLSNQSNLDLGSNTTYQLWMLYENDYLQYELGLMDEGVWKSKFAGMQTLYNKCQYRNVTDVAFLYSSSGLSDLIKQNTRDDCS